MRRNITIYSLFLISIIFVAPLCAQQYQQMESIEEKPLQKITLKDGTILKGNVIGFEDDAYIVETRHIGKVKIHSVNLKSIVEINKTPWESNYPSNQTGASVNSALDVSQNLSSMGSINQLHADLMKDPQINASMQEMINDPELFKLLMNKNLMDAALSMDPQKIQSNPEVQELLKNPKMQKLMEQIRVKLGSPQQP